MSNQDVGTDVPPAKETDPDAAPRAKAMMQAYLDALVARGDFRRFYADDVRFEIVGTDQRSAGAEAVEQGILYLHQVAFDARTEIVHLLADEQNAAAELVFAGTHTGEFGGVEATGNAVRVPYTVLYDLDGGRITALRVYMSMEVLLAQLRVPAPEA